MTTDDLIRRLAADAAPVHPRRIERAMALAAGAALVIAAAMVWGWFGVRHDLGAAILRPGVALKFFGALVLAAAGLRLACRLARPAGGGVCATSAGLAALAILAGAAALATAERLAPLQAVLRDTPGCVGAIALIAVAPLALALTGLRAGAPTRPAAAGAAAGLFAGGLAALAYAAWCPAEDVLFVIVAYGGALAAISATGAAAGAVALRW